MFSNKFSKSLLKTGTFPETDNSIYLTYISSNIQLLIFFSNLCSIVYHLYVKRKSKEKFQ